MGWRAPQIVEGTYALSETGTVTGYTNGTTWSCVTGAGSPVTVTGNQVTLTTGDDIACTITNTAVAAKVTPRLAPTPVYRYNRATVGDWVSVPQLPRRLRRRPATPSRRDTVLRHCSPRQQSDMVADVPVYSSSNTDWADVVDGGNLSGYGSKTFPVLPVQELRHEPGGGVSVAAHGPLADRERQQYSDATLQSWGYTSKTLLGYANASRGSFQGYFDLGAPQAAVVDSTASGRHRTR